MDWEMVPREEWFRGGISLEALRSLRRFLIERGAFEFPRLGNGLFGAAAGEGADFEISGYRSVWVRDNVQIAWAHMVVSEERSIPASCMRSLAAFYGRHRWRFVDIVEGRADYREPMNRPHIRFSGADLSELPEKWAHAQNDALGYFLWLTCRLASEGVLACAEVNWDILSLLVRFWIRVEVWQDEDSGHWEEVRKVSASSLGCVIAGLREFRELLERGEVREQMRRLEYGVGAEEVEELLERCRDAMWRILPSECVEEDKDKRRRFDGALLFLIYPLDVICDRGMEDEVLGDVRRELRGPYGIRRYVGDSYWCADYRELLRADQRTADFSDSLGDRDRLLKRGMEAQWCIFDPIVSCIYGRRYAGGNSEGDFELQVESFQRSLHQMTRDGGRFPAWRCPESWFCERGEWVPNDITPLLWTQGNLLQAFRWMELSLLRRERC